MRMRSWLAVATLPAALLACGDQAQKPVKAMSEGPSKPFHITISITTHDPACVRADFTTYAPGETGCKPPDRVGFVCSDAGGAKRFAEAYSECRAQGSKQNGGG